MGAKTLWNYGKRVELSEQCGTSTLVIHHECVTSIWLLVELALPKGSFFNYVDQIFPVLTTTYLPLLTLAHCLTWYLDYFLRYFLGSIQRFLPAAAWETLVSPNHTNENILRYWCWRSSSCWENCFTVIKENLHIIDISQVSFFVQCIKKRLITNQNVNIQTCSSQFLWFFSLKCWFRGQIISRVHFSNTYKLMCFNTNIKGNRMLNF